MSLLFFFSSFFVFKSKCLNQFKMLDVYINLWLSIGLYDEEPLEIETNSALSPPKPKKKKKQNLTPL
jgi:hypothetical protein